MKEFTYTVSGPQGLHARPVAFVARAAMSCASEVQVRMGDTVVDGTDMVGLMALCACRGDELTVSVSGATEDADLEAVRAVFDF